MLPSPPSIPDPFATKFAWSRDNQTHQSEIFSGREHVLQLITIVASQQSGIPWKFALFHHEHSSYSAGIPSLENDSSTKHESIPDVSEHQPLEGLSCSVLIPSIELCPCNSSGSRSSSCPGCLPHVARSSTYDPTMLVVCMTLCLLRPDNLISDRPPHFMSAALAQNGVLRRPT